LNNSDGSGKMITCTPELSQKVKSSFGRNVMEIRYDIFSTTEFEKKNENVKRYQMDFFQSTKPIAGTGDQTMILSEFTRLKAGGYCLVASSGKEGDFMLRFLVDAACATITELNEEVEQKSRKRKTQTQSTEVFDQVFTSEASGSKFIDIITFKICLEKIIRKHLTEMNVKTISIATCRSILARRDEDKWPIEQRRIQQNWRTNRRNCHHLSRKRQEQEWNNTSPRTEESF